MRVKDFIICRNCVFWERSKEKRTIGTCKNKKMMELYRRAKEHLTRTSESSCKFYENKHKKEKSNPKITPFYPERRTIAGANYDYFFSNLGKISHDINLAVNGYMNAKGLDMTYEKAKETITAGELIDWLKEMKEEK